MTSCRTGSTGRGLAGTSCSESHPVTRRDNAGDMIAPAPLHAAIFDMDGTLVDNMRYHSEAWVALSQRLGINATAERFEREFAGKKNEEILPVLLGRPLAPEELSQFAEEKETHYRKLYSPHLSLMRGTEAFI